MYDIKWIRDNSELFEAGRSRRGLSPISEKLLMLDDARRHAIGQLQVSQERRNFISKEIGIAFKEGDHFIAS